MVLFYILNKQKPSNPKAKLPKEQESCLFYLALEPARVIDIQEALTRHLLSERVEGDSTAG